MFPTQFRTPRWSSELLIPRPVKSDVAVNPDGILSTSRRGRVVAAVRILLAAAANHFAPTIIIEYVGHPLIRLGERWSGFLIAQSWNFWVGRAARAAGVRNKTCYKFASFE